MPKEQAMEVSTAAEQPLDRPTGKLLLSKKCVLVTVLVFNSLFVVSQLVGTVLSSSLTLFGDTVLMAIDTLCYALSYFAHRLKSEKLQRWVPLSSTVLLLVACLVTIIGAFSRLIRGPEGEEDVKVGIMVGFVVADLIIDCLFLGLFYRGRNFLFLSDDEPGSSDFNVLSVFAHAAADSLRTLAECVAVGVILSGQDATTVDSICAITMSGIAFPCGPGFFASISHKYSVTFTLLSCSKIPQTVQASA